MELEAINKNEQEIDMNISLFGKDNKLNFKTYYILNKEWFDNYKTSLKTQKNKDLFTNINDICPKVDSKSVIINNNQKTYKFPSNFVLVNQKILEFISNNFSQKNGFDLVQLSYEVFIFGECIIIKSRTYKNVIYASTLKEQRNNHETSYENDIRYIFEFFDSDSMEKELKFMNEKNFTNYLKFKNLNGKNHCDFGEVKDVKNKIIGHIIYNQFQNLSETAIFINKKKFLEKAIKPNTQNIVIKFNPYLKSILLGFSQFEKFTKGLKDIIQRNPNNKLITKFSQCLDDIAKKRIFDEQIEYEFYSSINTNKFDSIFNEILPKLDKELSMNKKHNKNFQNDESKARQYFKMEHKNPNIIENLFYLLVQKKLFCKECNLNMYYYEYNSILLIEIDKNQNNMKIYDKLFGIKNKYEKCPKCNNDCKTEKKFEEFPQILIAVINSKNDEKFILKDNFKIIHNGKFLYSLNCLIEKNTNDFYYLDNSNWYKIDIKTNDKSECNTIIHDINPSVLFFLGKFSETKYQNINNNKMNNSMMPNLNQNNNMMMQMNFNFNNNAFNNNLSMNNMNNKMIFNNAINLNSTNNINMINI